MSGEDAEQISWVIQDIAREFADQAPAKSSATRAYHLYERSGLDLDTFLDRVQQARLRTKRYTANIKSTPTNGQTKPKMAYMFAIVEELMGLKD